MTWTIRAAFGLVVAGAVIALLQLWLGLFDPDVFVKTMITFGVLLALIVAWNSRLARTQGPGPAQGQEQTGLADLSAGWSCRAVAGLR